jgi:hypothetical protein
MLDLLTRYGPLRGSARWMRIAGITVAICGFAVSSPAFEHSFHIETDNGSGVGILVSTPFRSTPQSGFVPIHVRIANDRRERQVWTFTFDDRGHGSGARGKYRETVSVGPMQVRETYLFVPRAGLESSHHSYQSISGNVQGPGVVRGSYTVPSVYRGSGHVTPFLLVSQSLASNSWSKLETQLQSSINTVPTHNDVSSGRILASRSSSRSLRGSPVNLAELPADERALSGVAGLILTEDDWRALKSPMQKTMIHWVQGGGHLAVVAKAPGALSLPSLPAFNGVDAVLPLGFGALNLMHLQDGELPVPNAAAFAIGLDAAPVPTWGSDYSSSRWSMAGWVGWPQLSIPLVIGFVCIFAIVIGPLNLHWFAPATKRHRLFFTVPALSIAASLCLIGVIAIGEGSGGTGARNVILSLDPAGTRVSLLQEQVARTRLLVRRNFKLDPRAAMAFVDPNSRRNEGRELGRDQEGGLGGDWFRSRAVQMHHLSTAIPSRAEVTVVKRAGEGKGPTLLSSVPGTLRGVFYLDEEKRYWRVDELATGTPTVLKAAQSAEYHAALGELRDPFSRSFNGVLDSSLNRPGHFYARAERSPEWPLETLPSIHWEKEIIFAFGPCTVKEGK